MTTRIDLQPAYVLHSQPFQNTSLLVDFLCLDHGRLRAVVKGARRPKSRFKALLQPFQPLLVTLVGRSELKSLTVAESSVAALQLQGTRLFSGLYINELLTRLLMFNEEHPDIYRCYQQAIVALQGEGDLQRILRSFELQLLEALGYGLNLQTDCHSGEDIEAEASYLFHPDIGFERVAAVGQPVGAPVSSEAPLFRGAHIRALAQGAVMERDAAAAALRITRMALRSHLGDKPLVSRDLFRRL